MSSNQTKPHQSPRRFDGVRAFMIVQLVLVLLVPFLFTQMGGCQGEKETYAVNLGPEVSAEQLDSALAGPLANTTPTSIKLGEGFIVSETQELGAGAAFAVVSDTSQTVVERQEDATQILLTVIEHHQKYVNGQVEKTSTEIPYRIEKNPSATEASLTNTAPATPSETPSSKFRPEVDKMLHQSTPTALLAAVREQAKTNAALKTLSGDSGSNSKVTYHGLNVVVSKEAPPDLVQKQPGCLGIPDCKITVHRVGFDMVFWENGQPERVHWDIAMSPEVPYLASMLNKCVTGLAALSGNQGNILVKQCVPVVFFRYEQPAQ